MHVWACTQYMFWVWRKGKATRFSNNSNTRKKKGSCKRRQLILSCFHYCLLFFFCFIQNLNNTSFNRSKNNWYRRAINFVFVYLCVSIFCLFRSITFGTLEQIFEFDGKGNHDVNFFFLSFLFFLRWMRWCAFDCRPTLLLVTLVFFYVSDSLLYYLRLSRNHST